MVIPGVNDHHVVEVARRLAGLGVSRMNAIPLIPVTGTAFAGIAPPAKADLARIRRGAARYVPQMLHCARCRSDAAGRLGDAGRCGTPSPSLVSLHPHAKAVHP